MEEVDSRLVKLCIEAATSSRDAVDTWRMQRRTLQRLPFPLASALLRRLLRRRLLVPSLLEMFKYCVEEVDLRGENAVDGEWMAYLGAFAYLSYLNVAGCNRINNPALWPLAGMTSLKELDLSNCVKVTDAGIKHLLSISQLEKLHLSQTGVTAEGIKLLSSLSNLSTLDLGGLPVSDMALSSLQVLTNLEYLDLWGSNISDGVAATIMNFPKLSFLNLAWTKVTMLPNLKSLECLNMSDCYIHAVMDDRNCPVILRKLIVHGASFLDARKTFSSIEASCLCLLNLSNTSLTHFDFLHNMHALEHLDLSFSTIRDDALEAISSIGLEHMRHLNLSHTKISSAGLEILAGYVPKLEVLLLSHTLIDDAAIAYVSMMPSLKALDLSYTNIKGLARHSSSNENEFLSLAALTDLKHLETLDLEGTQVTDDALHVVSGIKLLRHLSLNSTSLTEKCVEYLSSLEKLVNLGIQGTLLTNAALDLFKPPVTLEVLDLRGCWLLTMDALALFCKKHPSIGVRHDHLRMPSADPNSSSSHGAFSNKGSKTSKSKGKNGRSPASSPFKRDVLDQRIKYTIEELLAFQHLTAPLVPPVNIDTAALGT